MKDVFVLPESPSACAQVTPWNYPLMMAVWSSPSDCSRQHCIDEAKRHDTGSTLLAAKIMGEILPPGVFNVVCGERETGAMLTSHPIPAMISITGSVQAGKQVAAAAAPTLKRVHLELGGKAPVVVFADADLAAAAEGIAMAAYFNAGDSTAATALSSSRRSIRSLSASSPSKLPVRSSSDLRARWTRMTFWSAR